MITNLKKGLNNYMVGIDNYVVKVKKTKKGNKIKFAFKNSKSINLGEAKTETLTALQIVNSLQE